MLLGTATPSWNKVRESCRNHRPVEKISTLEGPENQPGVLRAALVPLTQSTRCAETRRGFVRESRLEKAIPRGRTDFSLPGAAPVLLAGLRLRIMFANLAP